MWWTNSQIIKPITLDLTFCFTSQSVIFHLVLLGKSIHITITDVLVIFLPCCVFLFLNFLTNSEFFLHCNAIVKINFYTQKSSNFVYQLSQIFSCSSPSPDLLIFLDVFKKKGERKHSMFLIALYLILPPDLILPYESPEQVLTRVSIPMIFGRQLQQIKF